MATQRLKLRHKEMTSLGENWTKLQEDWDTLTLEQYRRLRAVSEEDA